MTRKKRADQKEREKEVLKMFKKEGQGLLKSIKTARGMLKKDNEKSDRKVEWFEKPPPYTSGQ